MHRVTLISGDGIGPEVTCAARAIVEASGASVEFETVLAGQQAESKTGTPLPAAVFESIARTRLVMKGPTYTPFGGNYRVTVERPDASGKVQRRTYPSLAITLRKELGLFAGANIGPECAMFEAVHGTAPDIAGKDIANPMAMILSAGLMLRYIGEADAADRIDAALTAVLAEKKTITRDLGGTAGTRAFADAIVRKLKSN